MKAFEQFKQAVTCVDKFAQEFNKIAAQNYCHELAKKENELLDLFLADSSYEQAHLEAMLETEQSVELAVKHCGLSYKDLPAV